jgi:hypothetical protein
MKLTRPLALCVALAAIAGGAGCTHHHYYGAAPMADASLGGARVMTAPVVAGTYCDVPGTAGTPVIVQANPGKASTVVNNRRPPTVITSQAAGGAGSDNWRSSRDSGGASTRISGTLDDGAVAR